LSWGGGYFEGDGGDLCRGLQPRGFYARSLRRAGIRRRGGGCKPGRAFLVSS
jgi:hypothetical protein